MNKAYIRLNKKSLLAQKLLLLSCVLIGYTGLISKGYTNTYEIDLPSGTSSTPSITANTAGSSILINGNGTQNAATLNITGAASYSSTTTTAITNGALVNLGHSTTGTIDSLGTAADNTITLGGTVGATLQMGVVATVANKIILATGADVIDINGHNTTISQAISQAITGAATSFEIGNSGSAATLTLSAAATQTTPTTIDSAVTVSAGASNVLADATSLTVNGTFDMNGNTQTVNNLTGSGLLKSGSGTPALTIALTQNETFAGMLSSSIGNLTVSGSGTLTLSGASNEPSGAVVVGAGAGLSVANAGALGSGVTLNGGTLGISSASTCASAVTLDANSTINDNGNNVTLSGNITGSYGLTLAGSGTKTLSGTNGVSSYTVTGGILSLSSSSTIGSCTGITMSNGTKLLLGGAMTLPALIFD